MALRAQIFLGLFAACALAAAVPRAGLGQSITVDGRFSAAKTLTGPNYDISANLGKQVGSNLFHSFGKFGLATNETAAFSGPATINNVIGRVTGGNPSSIDGTIKSSITGANLFLINPSGSCLTRRSASRAAFALDHRLHQDVGRGESATNPDGST